MENLFLKDGTLCSIANMIYPTKDNSFYKCIAIDDLDNDTLRKCIINFKKVKRYQGVLKFIFADESTIELIK